MLARLHDWLPANDCHWHIGSVNQQALLPMLDWIAEHRASDVLHHVHYELINVAHDLREPKLVGIDRLAAAAGANSLRDPSRGAIIVDSGTAIKIDAVSADGVFLGGSISPGLRLSLSSLANGTNKLPNVKVIESTPDLIGKYTQAAICSGVYWTTVGGISGTVERMRAELADQFGVECDVFATGGAIEVLLPNLSKQFQHEPSLVLSGLAMAKV